MQRSIPFTLASLALAAFAVLAHARAEAGEVIANATVTLSPDEVKELFLGEKQFMGGLKLIPIDNAAQQPDFADKVLQLSVVKYSARWSKKAFREGLLAPSVKGSDAEVLSFVKSTPGAVGYVTGPVDGVKVLERY